MEKSEVQKALERFRNHVISVSRRNLTRLKKNSSRKLYDSLKGNLKVSPNSFELDFSMEDYGIFQDAGVSGTRKKYNTPYSYKSKMPPVKAFDKWLVRKGIAPRDKGKFTSRKSLAFLMARSVYRNGIKPSLFFTKPFEAAYKNLPQELIEKYGLDVIGLYNEQMDKILKKNG
jgi:hypothetical protein